MTEPCTHHWVLAPGVTNVPATCKHCGITRTFAGSSNQADLFKVTTSAWNHSNPTDYARLQASRARGGMRTRDQMDTAAEDSE